MIDTIYSDPDFLAHYGVKGMKWGVRNEQEPVGFRQRRLQRAIDANDRDVKSLRDAGYKTEAAAVKKVGDKNRSKLQALQNKNIDKAVHTKLLLSSNQKRAVYTQIRRYDSDKAFKKLVNNHDMVLAIHKRTKNGGWTPRNPEDQRQKLNMDEYEIVFDPKKHRK